MSARSAMRSETATSTPRRFTRLINSWLFPNSYPARATGPLASSISSQFSRSDSTSFRSEEHTSELQSQSNLVCRLLLGKKNQKLMTTLHSFNQSAIAAMQSATTTEITSVEWPISRHTTTDMVYAHNVMLAYLQLLSLAG